MADITYNDPLVTESKLTEFYNDIKPFLGCPAYVTQEGDADYYSTEEKVVGRWIDGRPIYQRVYNLNSLTRISNTSWTSVGIALDNKQTILRALGTNTYNGSGIQTISGELLTCVKNNEIVFLASRDGEVLECAYIVLQFTKSTDSAVTTIEQKPTHYSTDEQVVGTWIDGKPLYQKTIVTTTFSWSTATPHGIENIEEVVGIDCTIWTNLGAYSLGKGGNIDIMANVDTTQYFIGCTYNSFTSKKAYLTIRYTKTTD